MQGKWRARFIHYAFKIGIEVVGIPFKIKALKTKHAITASKAIQNLPSESKVF